MLLDFVTGKRCSEEDPGVALAIIEINGNDKFLLPEILDVGEMGTAAIRQCVTSPICAGTTTADAVRVSKREEQPGLRRAAGWNARNRRTTRGPAGWSTRNRTTARGAAGWGTRNRTTARGAAGWSARSRTTTRGPAGWNARSRTTARGAAAPFPRITASNRPHLLYQILRGPPRTLQPCSVGTLREPLTANQFKATANIRVP